MEKPKTFKDLFDEYQKLPENEKMKFDMKIVKTQKSRAEDIEKAREAIFEELSNIVGPDGKPYFYPEFLKKSLKIK